MRELDLPRIKSIQLDILCFVDKFCIENKINYYLTYGTLLGAVRHGGYIPWDDDIDICMLRPDYNRFMKEFNKNSSNKYVFESIETNSSCYFPYGKVFDTDTVFYEPDEEGVKTHVYIDIFVYDNAPDSKISEKIMYKKRDIYQFFRALQSRKNTPGGNIFKKRAELFLRKIAKLKPAEWYARRIIDNSKRYADSETEKLGDFSDTAKKSFSRKAFSETIEVSFENINLPAPVGYDELLTSFYGDYMKLPPVEQRVTHHKFKAYILDK